MPLHSLPVLLAHDCLLVAVGLSILIWQTEAPFAHQEFGRSKLEWDAELRITTTLVLQATILCFRHPGWSSIPYVLLWCFMFLKLPFCRPRPAARLQGCGPEVGGGHRVL